MQRHHHTEHVVTARRNRVCIHMGEGWNFERTSMSGKQRPTDEGGGGLGQELLFLMMTLDGGGGLGVLLFLMMTLAGGGGLGVLLSC